MDANRTGVVAMWAKGLSSVTAYAIGLPVALYGLLIVYLPRIRELPDAAIPVAAVLMAPVYLLLLVEEKLGIHRLAKILDEKAVSTWPEMTAVGGVYLGLLCILNLWLVRGNYTVLFRTSLGFGVICLGCLLAFVVLTVSK